ncbi:hypothetical protein [Arthrobacter koreensis]|uniref:hypothetical protein n=1 Tax=Arthrobacter koreensis TaxID=199136 RepID=UPI002DB8A661|nr:hypothetical protein [Arthrobacter koreensis]MEB7446654.1 hypothetical protein [Arthrobacter koreensis]
MAKKPHPEVCDIYVADPTEINVPDDHKEKIIRRYGIAEASKKSFTVQAIGRTTDEPRDDEKITPVHSPRNDDIGLTKEGWWIVRYRCTIGKALFKEDVLDHKGELISPEADDFKALWNKNSVLGIY